MARRRVRLVDVAAASGVSRTTVSFVLNGRDAGIPAHTRERVRAAAHELGYRPNSVARSLATGRTHRFGVVFSLPEYFGLDNTYFIDLLSGIADAAMQAEHNVVLHSAYYPDWRVLHDDIVNGASDGVLLVGRPLDDPLTNALLDESFPTVCVSYEADHPRCVSVDCDNRAGGALAVRYLLGLGHRRIAFVHGWGRGTWIEQRRAGALDALREAGLPDDCLVELVMDGHVKRPDWGEDIVQAVLERRPALTAAFCCDEDGARALAEKLPRHGVGVPADFSVVGFNATELSRVCRPALTAVWQPIHQIGRSAVEALVALADGEGPADRQMRLPIRLEIRASAACRADAGGREVAPLR